MCKEILFSVVIPSYNSSNTIERSINSILQQNYQNFEILIIDDGSNKLTKKVYKKIIKKSKKIRIIFNKNNLGVSKSRNIGINFSRGKYIIFLDSDDFFLKNFFQNLRDLISSNNPEAVIAQNKFISSNISDKKLFTKLFEKRQLSFFCWSYILQKKFIKKNKILFEDIKVFEDQLFVFKVIKYLKNYLFYRKKYIIRTENLSSLGRLTSYHSSYAYLQILNRILELIKKTKNKNILNYMRSKRSSALNFLSLFSLVCNDNEIKKLSKEINNSNLHFKNEKKDYYPILKLYRKKNQNKLIKLIKENKFSKKKRIYVYSAGLYSRIIIKLLKNKNIRISKIIDSNKLFQERTLKKIKIISYKKHTNLKNSFLISPSIFKKNINLIKKLGFYKRNIIFFKFYKFKDIFFK